MAGAAYHLRRRRRPLDEARRALAADFYYYALKLARPYRDRWPHLDAELVSAAGLAVVEAAEAFDPGRSVRFGTWAARRIRGALVDALQSGGRRGPAMHPLGPGDDRAVPDPGPAEVEGRDELRTWLEGLTARQAEAVRLLYLEGWTGPEAALRMDCTPMNVEYLRGEALAQLRRMARRRAAS